MRWIDLSAYGTRLYAVALHSGTPQERRVLVIDQLDEQYHSAVTSLGFVKRSNGQWVNLETKDINPRDYIRAFPKAKVREMERHEYFVQRDAVQNAPDEGVHSAVKDIPPAKQLGVNRLGQKVFEEDGRRHIVDSKGRRIREDSVGTAMPGMFLRAVDEGSLAMCAEGFIETSIAFPKEPFAVPAAFMKAIGVPDDGSAKFRSEVEAAAIRFVVKKGGDSLREKFGKALEISNGLRSFLPKGGSRFDEAIIGRRLLGLDRELIGKGVRIERANEELVRNLLPKATRIVETDADADYCVSFLKGSGEAIKGLAGRSPETMNVMFIPLEDKEDPTFVASELSRHGTIEAAVTVDFGHGRRLVATMRSGEPSQAPNKIPHLSDAGEYWSWASVVATERSRLIEAVKSGLSTEADLNAADASIGKNSHQVPYASASKAGTPRTMVPKELEGPTRQALDRIISNFGDVDARVATECGFPRNGLGEILSPEQVDAVALAIHAEERDRAMLIADNTGVGKGRTLMSLAKRAVLQGRKVLVLSEKDSNLSDLQRDVKHIQALDVIKPAVMNRDAVLVDEATGKPFETADRELLQDAVEKGIWPEGVQCVYATYSQFNNDRNSSPRSAWLHTAIDSDVLVIADEVHNAASGDSNTSANIAAAIANAGTVVLSSATFAGNAKMMSFFERVFPPGLSGEEIAAMMRKGGEQFQEVVSAMLVADGVMIRREKDLSDLQISQHLDEARLQRNREHMDALAAVIGEMALLSGELDAAIEKHNQQEANVLKGLQMKRMGFGSPLYTMTRLFTASLLAEFVAERAVEALRNGEKPIVLVENTIQGVLEDAMGGDGQAPDFKAVVHRVLDQMTKMTVVRADGEAARVDAQEGDRGVADAVAHIREMIDQLPPLPASAIDEVKRRIKEAGYSCGEITGRSLEIEDGKVVARKNRDRTRTKNDFNSGKLDALVMNVSGSTGIDLHASARFKDQRRRVMIELQGPSYVLKQIQAYGRISRYDEVVPSRIELPSSGLPSEARLAAMRNQKLRRLSANVTSNRDSAFLARNIPDLINSVGDAVITKYAEMRPDLMKRLCLAGKDDEEAVKGQDADDTVSESVRDTNRSANEFLSRLSLLPTDHQEKVLAELTAEYELHVAELEARGENPLRPRELEGIVHVRRSSLFEGSISSGALTAFDGPMHLLDVAIERVAEPIRAEAVMNQVEEGSAAHGKVRKSVSALLRNRDMYLEPFLPAKARTVEEAIAQGNKRIIRMVSNMEDLKVALDSLVPGREIEFEASEGEMESAVITFIGSPPPGYEHLPHLYRVQLAVPGATSFSTFRLDTLISLPGVSERGEDGRLKIKTKEGLEGADYDRVLDRFENAVARKLTQGRILTTNIFRAVRLATQHNLGSLVSFVDHEGNRHRGVLVKKGFEKRLDVLSLRVDGVDQAMKALVDVKGEIGTSPSGSKSGIVISPLTSNTWAVKLPTPPRRGETRRWPSEGYRVLYERGSVQADGKFSRFICEGEEDLRNALEFLEGAGFSAFYLNAKYRQAFVDRGADVADADPIQRKFG